ncbi:hypothetical protein QJS66_20270 [Kocuria rhizophila]|nr:hypothetical protein QJS66_20270 [Kocuria rhizophila]
MIGQGYHNTVTPAAIRRNILETRASTRPTPRCRPGICQGRLELLLTFRERRHRPHRSGGRENASLLDGIRRGRGSAHDAPRQPPFRACVVLVDSRSLPQTLAVLAGTARAAGMELVLADLGDPDAAAQAGSRTVTSTASSLRSRRGRGRRRSPP